MSSASTTTTTTTSISGSVPAEAARLRNWDHLSDYDLHHSNTPVNLSGASRSNGPIHNPPRPLSESFGLSQALHNPNDWPSNHRRIPPHRPINTQLDQSLRKVYTSTGERVFLTMMFSGLQVNVTANRAWNATLGKIDESWFKYKIGGEW